MPSDDAQASFDPQYFEKLFSIEDRHFWFRARRRVIASMLKPIVADFPAGYRVLEIGCGGGNLLPMLQKVCVHGHVIGVDLYHDALKLARRRTDVPLVRADIEQLPFVEPFEVIGLFDVIEHLPNDVAMLTRIRDMLRPGGRAVMTVPAYQALWSYFDRAAHHQRRYSPRSLRQSIVDAGLEVEFLSPFMTWLFPLMYASRRMRADRPDVDSHHDRAAEDLRIRPGINAILRVALSWEPLWLGWRLPLPIGTSLIAVARRP